MRQYDIKSQNQITKELYILRDSDLENVGIIEYIDDPRALKDAVSRIQKSEQYLEKLRNDLEASVFETAKDLSNAIRLHDENKKLKQAIVDILTTFQQYESVMVEGLSPKLIETSMKFMSTVVKHPTVENVLKELCNESKPETKTPK